MAEGATRRHLLKQRVDRGQNQPRPPLGRLNQARQPFDPTADDIDVGRYAVIGQAVPGRDLDKLHLRREERDRLRQPGHALVVKRHVQQPTSPPPLGDIGEDAGVLPFRRTGDQKAGRAAGVEIDLDQGGDIRLERASGDGRFEIERDQ